MQQKRGKKTAVVPTNSGIFTLGLDVGYGVTKAVIEDRSIVFPSVIGHAHEIKFRHDEITTKYPGDQLTDGDGQWFVGDLALNQVPAGELLRLRGRTSNEDGIGNAFRLRMAKAAIGKCFPGILEGDMVTLRIATGLPVDHMGDSVALKQALLGLHRIVTDSTDMVANVVEVFCMPQPYGTIYSQQILPTGEMNPRYGFNRTGVVDVGTYTVDVCVDDNGEYIDPESGSVEAGVSTAQQRLSAVLEQVYREKFGYKIIEDVLRNGKFKARGEWQDHRADVQEALKPLRDATLGLLNEKWRTGTNIDVIWVSGGGAALVFDAIKAAYPQAQLATDAQLANARGYLNYAVSRELA